MLDVSDRIIWIRDGRIDKIVAREDAQLEVGMLEGEEA
jgi:putative ABC transport system ATP-binding protein